MSSRYSFSKLFLIAVVLQIVWGLVPSASNVVISEIPVELYIAIRWTISSLLFLGFLFFTSKWFPKMDKKTFVVMFLGILGYALASFGTLYGLKIGGVTNFALMGALNPIITSVTAILFLREKPGKLFYFALPLCILGLIMLVVGKHEISSWSVAFSSSILIIGAAVLEATVFVFSKKLKVHFTSFQYLAISQLAAALFMWILQLGFFQQTSQISNLSSNGWWAAIFVSVVACVLCYAILYWLLNYVDGHKLALFEGIHVISAALFGWYFFNESLNTLMIFGGFVLLAGLILGNLKSKNNKTKMEAIALENLTSK
ncbi:MAG: DMT family transporter [Bdellovibrionota bacterium]